MAEGPGKYDEYCTKFREELQAEGLVLIVFNGKFGQGFEAQLSPEAYMTLPEVLRSVADQVEHSLSKQPGMKVPS